ncbi:hypothetical protein PCO87_14270 [Pectobacteriaceae bacterium C52]|nr:hypothetical protein PCO87_14270 [Pectobacteriaceae bacterium C52]WJY13631.1 hypothetical protein PCO82_13760 [Pectobacteriaceae bacterium CE90]
MTISTAEMIEAISEVAIKAETLEEHEVLNSIANCIEILTAENASMDLQLNSIRAALNISQKQTVQAGVIAKTTQLNEELLSLRTQLSKSVALANKLRRTAKGIAQENQQLRTELVGLAKPVPPAAIQLVVPDEIKKSLTKVIAMLDRHSVILDCMGSAITLAELIIARDGDEELNACRAAMFQSGNSPVIPDGYAPLYWLVDGDANFYTISDQQGWIARIQMNGSITTQQQETWLSRRFVEGVRFCDASGSSLSQSEGGEA